MSDQWDPGERGRGGGCETWGGGVERSEAESASHH